MPLKYLFGKRLGRYHLQPASAIHQVRLEVSGGANEHLRVGAAVGGFEFFWGVVDGKVTHVVLFNAETTQHDAHWFGAICHHTKTFIEKYCRVKAWVTIVLGSKLLNTFNAVERIDCQIVVRPPAALALDDYGVWEIVLNAFEVL